MPQIQVAKKGSMLYKRASKIYQYKTNLPNCQHTTRKHMEQISTPSISYMTLAAYPVIQIAMLRFSRTVYKTSRPFFTKQTQVIFAGKWGKLYIEPC